MNQESMLSKEEPKKGRLHLVEPTKNDSLLLTPKETWEKLKISRSLCYHLIRTGEIKSIRLGRTIRVPMATLLEWLENKMKENESD